MLPISYSREDIKIPNGMEETINEKEFVNKRSKIQIDIQSGNCSPMVSPTSPSKRANIKDFEIIKDLGRGAYAKVCLAKLILNNKKVAIKIVDKKFMNKLNKSHEALIEREILSSCNHPNIIKLTSTFHDKDKLYFVLEYAPNKDLASFLRCQGTLSFELGRFYAAEILNVVEYMHGKNIAHRDLKPENIVLDQNMHIRLVDFSTAAMNGMYFDKKENKFLQLKKIENGAFENEQENENEDEEDMVGTAEYASPEMLKGTVRNVLTTDIWAFGCIIYKFYHGKTPFHASNEILIFDNIQNMRLNISKDLPEVVQDLIKKLLIEIPEMRIGTGEKGGNNDINAIKNHEFFKGVDFSTINSENPPIKINFLSKSDSDLSTKSIRDISDFNITLNPFNHPDSGNISPLKKLPIIKYNSAFNLNLNYPSFISEYSFESFADLQDEHIIEDYLTRTEEFENNKNLFIRRSFNKINEVVLLEEGYVKIQSFFLLYSNRKIKLFSNNKLEIWDYERNSLLSVINIDTKCRVSLSNNCTFELVDGRNSKHRFKTHEKDASTWVEKLNILIKNYN